MAADNAAPMTRREKFWLILDAIAALTDQAFDLIMMHEFAINGDWIYFYVGLGTIFAPIVLTKCTPCCGCGPVESCIPGDDDEAGSFFVQFVPGLNMLLSASYAIVLPRGEFETRATKKEIAYRQTRAFEAFFEAGPQTIFQVIVALHQVEGIRIPILIVSLALSFFSLTKTLVSFFIFQDYIVYFSTRREGARTYCGNFQRALRNDFPDDGTKFRFILLSSFYALFEVISVVLSVALLGYFCGWYSIVASFAIQYVLLFIYLRARGLRYDFMSSTEETKGNWRYMLIPILTSFVGGRAIPFGWYLCVRLLILGAYVAAAVLVGRDGPDSGSLGEVLVWAGIVATGSWILLVPAFVNSCHNLGVAFYSWSEDRRVTGRFTRRRYPLEITESNVRNRCCGFVEQTSASAENGTDAVATAVSFAAEGLAR